MKGQAQRKRKYTTITIPAPLFERIKANIRGTGFSSVSDYVTYVMRETVSEMEMKRSGKGAKTGVMEKLRALGYA
jgi:metal-responsive CopG/Arc/MetJ family transcriptional regulator